ncbi:MAG: hypothetical protein ABR608_14565 [Pseudonocardiaceae bacterium]
MSSEYEEEKTTGSKRKTTWQPMRGDWSGWRPWSEEEQARIDIRECTDARCMNVDVNVGYQGLVENSALSQSAGVGDDLRAAWKTKLAGEGKAAAGTSLRDTIFGSPGSK